jgi:hypothetical protein
VRICEKHRSLRRASPSGSIARYLDLSSIHSVCTQGVSVLASLGWRGCRHEEHLSCAPCARSMLGLTATQPNRPNSRCWRCWSWWVDLGSHGKLHWKPNEAATEEGKRFWISAQLRGPVCLSVCNLNTSMACSMAVLAYRDVQRPHMFGGMVPKKN